MPSHINTRHCQTSPTQTGRTITPKLCRQHLAVTTDSLVFDDHERQPDEELRLQFEATTHLDPEGKALVKALLEAVILRQESRRWANAS